MKLTFLQELGAAAQACVDPRFRELLKNSAAEIDNALTAAFNEPTRENLQALNGAWSKAERVFKNTPPLGGSGNNAGRMRVTEEMRQAA